MTHPFFTKIGGYAVDAAAGTGLLPSVAMAQAALESNWGKSQLSSSYNNLFGIKAKKGEPSVSLPTTEQKKDGTRYNVEAAFRVFDSYADAFLQRITFLNLPRYKKVLAAKKPADQARALQAAGYATDVDYAKKLINIINSYNLNAYDDLAKKKFGNVGPSTQV
jgi:flagellum-specific peptidoglycan hydrolase FlgJ